MTLTKRLSVFTSFLFALSVCAFADGAIIEGQVKESKGKALPGAVIKATRATTRSLEGPDESKIVYEARTDDEGKFILQNLPAGSYSMVIERAGYRSIMTRERVTVSATDHYKIPKPFELVKNSEPYGIIRGAVLDDSGFTLPNCRVTIDRVNGKFRKAEKETVEGGEFAFRVPAEKGTYKLEVSASGFESASKEVTIDGDEIRQVVVTLKRKK